MAAPMTTAPQSKIEAPWEDCPTSTLAPPTATVPTKATAHACPERQVLPKRVGEQESQSDASDGAGERGEHAEGGSCNDDHGQGHGDRPAPEHDGGARLCGRRGGALLAGSA